MLRLRKISRPGIYFFFSVNISFTFLRLPCEWDFLGFRFIFKTKPEPVIFLIFSSRLHIAWPKRVLKILSTACSGCLLRISVIILEPVLRPLSLQPVLKNLKSPQRRTLYRYPLHSGTSLVNSTIVQTATLIYIVPCISLLCNWQMGIYFTENLFLKCIITTRGISLSSNATFHRFTKLDESKLILY